MKKTLAYMHDLFCGPRKKVVRVGMDAAWFAQQWKRAEVRARSRARTSDCSSRKVTVMAIGTRSAVHTSKK